MDHIFDNNQPIFLQIMQRIYAQILRGKYQPGDKLPSVIDAAMHFKVNHNTIVRVYNEMTRQGIAVTRRGEGTFVTEDRQVIEQLHHTMREALLNNFYTEMRRLGYSSDEILSAITHFVQSETQELVMSKEETP
jgi:GntR family transcriptional regulator